jgi:type II secretory pathway component GspD/PulD (secretin)
MVESTTEQASGVPGLRSVPLVGGLFSWNGNSTSRTERLFLITPKVVGGRTAATEIGMPATDASRLKLSLSMQSPGALAARAQGESAAQSSERDAQDAQQYNSY